MKKIRGRSPTSANTKPASCRLDLAGQRYALALKVAELCPDVFEIHETHRDGKLVKYVTRKEDADLIEVDPTRDLNACAEFEKELTDGDQRDAYDKLLIDLCCEFPGTHVISATAEQRCRAFIALHGGTA